MRRKVFFFICAPPLPRLGSAEAAERPKQLTAEPFFRAKTPRQLTSAAAKKDEAAPKLFLRSAARVAPTRRRDVGLAHVDESDVAAAAESHQELVRVNLEKSSTLQSLIVRVLVSL